jgi:Excalibur calcium-binding domain
MAGAAIFVVTAVAAGSMLAVASPSADSATHYKNCAAMHADWPHGVGKLFASDHVANRKKDKPVTTFHLSIGLYNANKTLDTDHDGIACEQR